MELVKNRQDVAYRLVLMGYYLTMATKLIFVRLKWLHRNLLINNHFCEIITEVIPLPSDFEVCHIRRA